MVRQIRRTGSSVTEVFVATTRYLVVVPVEQCRPVIVMSRAPRLGPVTANIRVAINLP